MRTRILTAGAAILASLTIAVPAASAANSTQILGTHCSVYANAPTGPAGRVNENGYVSCASGYNLSKQVDINIEQAVWTGWAIVYSGSWSPWSFSDPYGQTVGVACTPGGYYRGDVFGQVQSGNVDSGAEVVSSTFTCS